MSLWDEVKKNVVDLYSVTSDKTSEMAKVSTRRWDKFGISRDIERQFSELGNLVYTGLQEGDEDILKNPEISVIMSRIGALEEELARKEEEIENIHQEHRERKAAEAAAGATGGFEDSGAAEADEASDSPEVVLKDPVLDKGADESAILVEPVVEDEPIVESAEEDDSESPKKDS